MSKKILILPGDGIGQEVTSSAIQILEFIIDKFNLETLDFKLINSQYIEHKLTHIIIKSTFWFTNEKIDIDEGVFTTILEDYPMSKLMHKFIEKYRFKLAYSEVKMVN